MTRWASPVAISAASSTSSGATTARRAPNPASARERGRASMKPTPSAAPGATSQPTENGRIPALNAAQRATSPSG